MIQHAMSKLFISIFQTKLQVKGLAPQKSTIQWLQPIIDLNAEAFEAIFDYSTDRHISYLYSYSFK